MSRAPHSRRLLAVCIAITVIAGLAGVRIGTVAPAAASSQPPSGPTTTTPAAPTVAPGQGHWIASWGAAAMPPSPADPMSERGFNGQTLREIVFSTAGGSYVKVRFTNAFGRRPLTIARAAVALAGWGPDVVAGTQRKLSFHGHPNVTIPAGGVAISDPVKLAVPALSRLAVSLYLPHRTGPATQHAQAHDTNWVASGSHILDSGQAFGQTTDQWFFLDTVNVYAPRSDLGALVAIGDSITAGVGSVQDADASWPDDLARRLATAGTRTLSVVDEGIGGNRVLHDSACCGEMAVQRFAPDVLDLAGVRDVILLEGINDIGFSQNRGPLTAPHTAVTAGQIIAGYRRMIAAAHARGLRVFGATLLPFRGARYWTRGGERTREQVNHWIMTTHAFDGVIDFAQVMRDPRRPLHLNPRYDCGDHLHPNDAGYWAMANAISLADLVGPAAPAPAHP